MCKHITNVQVSIRSACCRKWFDCADCHKESEDHPLKKTMEMIFACKKCKKVFRKDTSNMEESDEYCPYCDNHFIIEAVTAAQKRSLVLEFESDDPNFIRDERCKPRSGPSFI
eukprot:TRINITY_DN918_c0_g1_i1.p1 TRINITY_DN918_c0_g1~~TRINITY_DN918_c0_g1_i1.p1  ORF type:complete len:113 (+),score=20.45 TRINITY_DN918_c0_g1_i1:78-416(+)